MSFVKDSVAISPDNSRLPIFILFSPCTTCIVVWLKNFLENNAAVDDVSQWNTDSTLYTDW